MKTLTDIRSAYLDYFAKQGHAVLPSAPLVPQNDPTLMFTAAGMVPFKDYFTGKDVSPNKRVATSQKCVRAGGKHNDLENVGYTARHHTFFEMLGNFSFGDYFKDDAIHFAWELITKEFGLPKNKLLVTVYHTDDEAVKIWKKVAGLGDDKIIRIATKDNFWSAGDTGPCGPCTEIFYDNGDTVFGGPPGSKDEDGDRFKEIWNLVFMQYDQVDGKQVPLPKPSIDTGMGLERMTSVMQGKLNNFDIDLFQAIIHDIQERTKTKGEGENLTSQRVISDHLRAAAFLIADGVMPGNEGRGYVLRRIMRRAMRHAHLLGAKDALMYQLVPTLITQMGAAYPELNRAEALITDTLSREENRFRETLARGLKLLDDETAKLKSGGTLPGEVAFKLYDTFGFPVDLTNDVLVRKGYQLDSAGFDASMQKQQETARKSWTGSGDAATDKIWFEVAQSTGTPEFLGYSTMTAQGVVKAIVKDGKIVNEAKQGDEVQIVLSQTPFYAESGGQTGDTGTLSGENKLKIDVTDTKKPVSSLIVHIGKVASGVVKTGDGLEAHVNETRRRKIMSHHSGVHLLHEALRRNLGDHVAQKGSLVEADRLRLDFSQPDPITDAQMNKIISDVRAQIAADTEITTRVMSLDEARETGARALFGEKYGAEVRVVGMGTQDGNKQYSVELCGGTHAARTGEIGAFRIIAESGVSAGVRRVSAVVGEEAEKLTEQEKTMLNDIAAYFGAKTDAAMSADQVSDTLSAIAGQLKTQPGEILERLQKIKQETADLQKELTQMSGEYKLKADTGSFTLTGKDAISRIEQKQKDIQSLRTEIGALRRQAAMGSGADEAVENVNGVKLIARLFDDMPAKDLRPLADRFKQQIGSGVVVLLTKADGRVSLVVGVTDDLTGKINAVDLVKVAAEALGGKGGGGRPDMAQAGGPEVAAAETAVDHIRKTLAA
jgi:alanyl-tRNA synthetase